jgi:hypothetical protein
MISNHPSFCSHCHTWKRCGRPDSRVSGVTSHISLNVVAVICVVVRSVPQAQKFVVFLFSAALFVVTVSMSAISHGILSSLSQYAYFGGLDHFIVIWSVRSA